MDEIKPVEWFRRIFDSFEPGQTVTVVASKERTLTVTGSYRATGREPYRCNAVIVEFEGYGTEYELEIPVSRDGQVTLLYPSSDNLGDPVKTVEFEDDGPQIVSDTTVEDLGIAPR